ncbi:transglutaminase domain-containing protein [Luteimonas yindakuii]|uniref:Transglutaminase domain-containing protein n=1 Tax=Luteimonas yindakuii TaxID=2565782 RepID=A0A4Z1RJ00_9GAMM|nr:transglutaminase-like domain-containing protein [Luteimonas yindakuii]TKS53621.1 transglutaminase domain-containing protein [Luteimonas yindakuii]
MLQLGVHLGVAVRAVAVGIVCLLPLAAGAHGDDLPPPAPPGVHALVERGDFTAAENRIATLLATEALSPEERRGLEFQRERMRRIRLDFGLDEAAARAAVRRQVPDLRDAEFDAWSSEGLLESMRIDGQTRYFNRSVSNMFRLHPAVAARRAPPVRPFRSGPYEQLHPHHREVVEAARASGATSVVPRRVRVTQSLTVKPDAVPAGETVRAWIPYPREIGGQQEGLRLVASAPSVHRIAPADTLQRTVYMEQPAVAGEPTHFSATYELTVHARRFDIDPARVERIDAAADPALAPHVAERAPHIVFSPAMRAFSDRVVGDETNPYRIAQKLFAAVDDIPWGGAREYSTIDNLGEHALHAGHADCGQVTLLLMTLLRMNGIPARWQSGWVYSEDAERHDTMHDWGWLYLAPYGWVPMDVTTGQLASEDDDLRWFYLGGLDAYRIAFNDDFGRAFVPAKTHFRSETVDSQRGEAEWSGGNLYFDQWDYAFDWQMLPAVE